MSFLGRITLAKAILEYTMQSILLPIHISNKLEQMTYSFVWGSVGGEQKCYSIDWSKFRKSKLNRGIGVNDLHLFNKYLIMKLGWSLIHKPEVI